MFENDPEPMPPWEDGDSEKLEMLCHCSEVEAFGVQKYPDLVQKTAKVFYSGVKLHVFPNGNKRFALMTTIVFLILNGHRLRPDGVPPGVLSDLATEVAKTDPHQAGEDSETIIARLVTFFEDKLEPYDWRAALNEGDDSD